MGLILSIDTATNVCSAALGRDGVVVGCSRSKEQNTHSEVLSVLIEELLGDTGFNLSDLDAVAVSAGPGSYTGLRIGVSTAKGICYAIGVPLVSVPSLQVIAAQTIDAIGDIKGSVICPMIDARRMEVYAALYDADLNVIRDTEAVILSPNMFDGIESSANIVLSGNGADKVNDMFEKDARVKIIKGVQLDATFMSRIAEGKFSRGEFESLAYYEPFYLKEFIAGKPSVKGLV